MRIFENIVHIHTAFIFILVFALLIYINTKLFSRIRKVKWGIIEFSIFFILAYKCILDWHLGESYSSLYWMSNALIIISFALTFLFFVYGLFIGFKKMKNDVIIEIRRIKYLLLGAAVAILTAPFMYSLPSHNFYQPERSFYAVVILIIFLVIILGISPLFYTMQKAISLKEKTYETLKQRILALSLYWACLISNILVLSFITLIFVSLSMMAFVGAPN